MGSVLCLLMLFSALAQEEEERIGEYDDLLQMFSGRPSEVTVYLSEEFLGRLMENEWDLFYQMTENAGISWWEFEIDRDVGRIRLLDIEYYEDYYDEIVIPKAIGKAHPKAAITLRNRWMVDTADLVIAYIEHEQGGAYEAVKYANTLGKRVINLTA